MGADAGFVIQDRCFFLVARSRHLGSQGGNARVWSEDVSRALTFSSRAEAESAIASEGIDAAVAVTPAHAEDGEEHCATRRLERASETSALRAERDQALLVVQALGQRIESLRASLAESAELADSLSSAPAVRALSDRWRASADLPPGGAAPRQTVFEGLVRALEEAATSLETASRWGTREDEASDLAELRQWARSRAECARRAIAGVT